MANTAPNSTRRPAKKKLLNEAVVEAAVYDPHGPKVQYLWDTKTSGFGIRLYPSGKKSYVVGYRKPGNPTMRFHVFSQVGRAKVKPAREAAAQILANHIDPIAEKQEAIKQRSAEDLEDKRNPTISALIDEYFAYHEKRQKAALALGRGKHLSDQSLQQYRWAIEKHIRPYWRDTPVKQMQPVDVSTFIRELAIDHTDSVANNCLQRLKGLMKYAKKHGYIALNPTTDTDTDYEYLPTTRVLSENEIRTLWFNLANTSISKSIQLAFKLLLTTAQRRSEIVKARWDWVDLEQKILTVPNSNVKNRKGDNIVPLSDLALEILGEMKELSRDSAYLVPSSQHPNEHTAPQTVTNQLRANITNLGFDLDSRFTPHDLRRTVATMLSSEEVERDNIKVVLNHSFSDATEIYINNAYVNQKRRYLDLWAAKLRQILDGDRSPSNVVAIDR